MKKIVYGIHAVHAALSYQSENVLHLYCCYLKQPSRLAKVLDKALKLQLTVHPIAKNKLDKLAKGTYHQGIAAELRSVAKEGEAAVYAWLEQMTRPPLLLILEGIQDPHNLGACLRSAEALGVDKVILLERHTASLNATVSKVACGADLNLAIAFVSNMQRFIKQIKQRGVWVVATQAEAKPLNQIDLKVALALVMGSEGKGLRAATLAACDEVASIPLQGKTASLNVSVATGICLYECWRQRQ